MPELYGKLRTERGYSRHACSLFRIVRKMGFYVNKEKHKKYVPKQCYSGKDNQKFYQYTVIDEASRERFIYPYMEHSSYSTIDFIKRAILYFGYNPKIIQTDNGFEFTHGTKTDRVHPFDVLCNSLNIEHKLIKPRTPRHNGKVERTTEMTNNVSTIVYLSILMMT